MKLVGFKRVAFQGNDGNYVTGGSFYVASPIDKNGQGYQVDKVFLSDKKLAACGYEPVLEQEVIVYYNRYGKADRIEAAN